jgi:hypothetical protein
MLLSSFLSFAIGDFYLTINPAAQLAAPAQVLGDYA